eukprot:scpid47998/ scgid29963/ 
MGQVLERLFDRFGNIAMPRLSMREGIINQLLPAHTSGAGHDESRPVRCVVLDGGDMKSKAKLEESPKKFWRWKRTNYAPSICSVTASENESPKRSSTRTRAVLFESRGVVMAAQSR